MALTLCATARLAEALRSAVPAGADGTWETPAAFTVGAWLARLVEDAALDGSGPTLRLLDGACERLLWEQVIAASLPDDALPLFDLAGLAAAAHEAHALALIWNLELPPAALAEEGRLFVAWRREFRKRCAAGGWTEAARLPEIARSLIAAGSVPLPAAVDFAGFDRYTPEELRLRQTLGERGVRVGEYPAGAMPATARHRLACDDAQAEALAIAAWARDALAADPDARLGIVVPDLAERLDALGFALEDALHPEILAPGAPDSPRMFNISLGRPLASQPLAAVALDLLALGVSPRHEQAVFSALLLSPFWSAGQGEADARARIDRALRDELEFFTDLPALQRLVKRLYAREKIEAPRLAGHLEAFAATLAQGGPRRRPPSAWGTVFLGWLEALGWPGDRPLSSPEYQVRRSFLAALEGLARYDELLPAVGAGEALRRLAALCREQVFQPETRGKPSIEVLGILESTGLTFDALWVAGMNDDRWPPNPRPNPLLPAEIQRRAGSPHASAEVELAFAAAVHRRLIGAAPAITFSWRRQDGARLLRPSPLLAGIPEGAAQPPRATPPWPSPARLESLADARAPAVAPGEKVPGGTGLLKAQAICPAWAFYQYRLGARSLRPAVEGLDAMERGTLVHGALEHFWRGVADRAALLALDAEALAAAVAAAVTAALADFEDSSHRELPPRFRQLEAQRLERLLRTWLAVEARRQDFAVLACEQDMLLDIEGIQVRTVIDRIDRLADGGLAVIDYKTGHRIDTRNWAEERITEPQLPLYAALAVPLAGGEPVAAVAFARVSLDEAGFAGVGERKDLLPGITGLDDPKRKAFPAADFPDWPAVLRHWQERLRAVAAEVGAGEASVRFADPKALLYCEVLPLLRLAERAAALPGPEGAP